MAPGSTLVLSFTKHANGRVSLNRTQFTFRETMGPIEIRRGLYGKTFKWTAGLKALSILLLRTVAQEVLKSSVPAEGEASETAYILQGRRRSPAASLNDALTKNHAWIFDMFGGTTPKMPLLKELVRRRNPDFHTDEAAPVELWLNTDVFPADRIKITLNGEPVRDPETLEQLADDLTSQWPRKSFPVASDSEHLDVHAKVKGMYLGGTSARVVDLLEGIYDLMDVDVDWEVVGPPECPFLGRWRGKDRVLAVAKGNFARIQDYRPKVHTVLHQANTAIVVHDDEGIWEPNGKRFGGRGIQSFTFRDGKIVHMYQVCSGFFFDNNACSAP